MSDAAARIDALADALLARGDITDPAWRDVLHAVPRHLFVPRAAWAATPGRPRRRIDADADPDGWWDAVYDPSTAILTQFDDGAGDERRAPTSSLSAPDVALPFLESLHPFGGQRVLDVGTGTGWTAAALGVRVGDRNVVSVEVDARVAARAAANLDAAGRTPILVIGDAATAEIAPGEAAPRDTGPGGTAPHRTAPHGTAPHGTAPHGTAPRGTGPSEPGPRDTGPSDAGPREAGPRGTAPRDTGPGEAGPREAGPGGSRPGGAGPRGSGPDSAGPGGAGPGDADSRGIGPCGAEPRSAGPGDACPGAAPAALPDGPPFDLVHVACGVTAVPAAWVAGTRPGGALALPWMPDFGYGFRVCLAVLPDGTATGRLAGSAGYMMLRAQRGHRGTPARRWAEAAGPPRRSSTRLDPRLLVLTPGGGLAAAMAGLVPGVRADLGGDPEPTGEATLWLLDAAGPGGAWASVDYAPGRTEFEVEQAGDRDLWAEAESAFFQWLRWGRPPLHRFGLTVTPTGQHVWLDAPANPLHPPR